jgi:predicted nucleic acid-binding protein
MRTSRAFSRRSHESLPLERDARDARASSLTFAVVSRLRAADAVYMWLAAHEGVPLVTSDDEILQRGAASCRVERP